MSGDGALLEPHAHFLVRVGLRFVTPFSVDAKVIQHTIQLIPRLSEPTLVTAVLVEPNVPVKKGQPLFEFDRRPYEYKVNQLQAQLAQAKQNVLILKADSPTKGSPAPWPNRPVDRSLGTDNLIELRPMLQEAVQ